MPEHCIVTILLLPVLCAISGCLVDGTLSAGGGGTVKARYRIDKSQTADQQKSLFTGPNMSVTSATLDAEHWVTVEAKYADITKLSTAPFFKDVTIALTSDAQAGTTTLTATRLNPNPAKLPESVLQYYGNDFAVTLTMPGGIIKSNATSTAGNTATWKMTVTRILGDKAIPFEVTYKTPAAAPTAGK